MLGGGGDSRHLLQLDADSEGRCACSVCMCLPPSATPQTLDYWEKAEPAGHKKGSIYLGGSSWIQPNPDGKVRVWVRDRGLGLLPQASTRRRDSPREPPGGVCAHCMPHRPPLGTRVWVTSGGLGTRSKELTHAQHAQHPPGPPALGPLPCRPFRSAAPS